MDKNAIKKYATWARRELISRVSQKAAFYEITEKDHGKIGAENIGGRVLNAAEKKQRDALIRLINKDGYEQAMEEVAYTWFNRFCALRYMEVNNYLPSHVRVFTDDEGAFKPQILSEAINLELDGLDMELVYAYKENNELEKLYRYLLIVQCNALNSILPGLFQTIEDYTELLLPDNILREGSVIEQMVALIPEEDWTDQVQIIGWLYQYYNAEKKDEVFAALKKNVKITKENIPAATQLFTPDWIVRYMVENSLGRLWVEGHPNDALKSNWKYYLDEAEQEPDVQIQLDKIREEYAALNPQDIRCVDPCMGSGHILVYMFDVLVQIYEAYGYSARDAARSIVENNLYGLDIDERAAQLAYFSVMMKARGYDRRFFSRGCKPKVYAIRESNNVDSHALAYFVNGDPELKKAMDSIIEDMRDAREYGSLINVRTVDFSVLYARFDEIADDVHIYQKYCIDELLPLVRVAEILAMKYHIVNTNPPYRGMTDCNINLNTFVENNYRISKSDMYSVFIEKCLDLGLQNSYIGMITMQSWMYLSSYKSLRKKLLINESFVNMIVLGSNAFDAGDVGTVVQATTFIINNSHQPKYCTSFIDVSSEKSSIEKEKKFLGYNAPYIVSAENFLTVASYQFMYDITPTMLSHFKKEKSFSEYAVAKPGMQTSDNDRFLRFWSEVEFSKIGFGLTHDEASVSDFKWFPYNKGVGYRKWYGNNDYVVNFRNDGEELKYWLTHNPNDPKTKSWSRNLRNYSYYFEEGITFTAIGLAFSARLNGPGYLFDTKGPTMFGNNLYYLCGFVNGKVFDAYNRALCKQMTKSADSVNLVPVKIEQESKVKALVQECVKLSKEDWDSFEMSWDFMAHPLIRPNIKMEEAFALWENECTNRFNRMKANEEELNRIFIDIYDLGNELTPKVKDNEITIHLADKKRDIRSFISYSVGCMFGRYSLDYKGLVYAGGKWDEFKYKRYSVDKDNIIPICDDEYFADDIVNRFVEFVRTVYGTDTLNENLRFIADALGGDGQPKEVIRNYFISGFYDDHLKIYQKRPIYWLFDSGKKNGFKAIIYMHRYRSDTIARIRTDYVHEQQSRYRTAIMDLKKRISNTIGSERIKLNKQLAKTQAQLDELGVYEEKIHHLADQMISIDLDDGVKRNYDVFKDVLAKIK
ncbi:MAG: BREX-1 system adenine-specific DNA-methyltransferase PglX [Lachnospiraceae bacterium]|nr:BREX-1 system adenine-specific DNA-methyltransferase PglX [Lachnospiraceae bacterium]